MGGQMEPKVWFVTGASGGFGRAICDIALERGHRVVATVREQSGVSAFESEHPGVLALALDVTDARSVRRAVDHAVGELGRIDVLVNNAGYGHFGAVEELEDDDIRAQFEVNLFGVIAVTRAVLPQLRRQRSGHIVQMSSLNGVVGLVGGGYYAASKFAVEGLSESLAQEVAPLGIRVTIVDPGPHRTGFAGEGARLADPIEDYAGTVGAARGLLADLDGNQPGDPRRAAAAITEAIEAPDPPLRLALGEYAVAGIREKLEQQRAELERWQELSVSTAFVNG